MPDSDTFDVYEVFAEILGVSRNYANYYLSPLLHNPNVNIHEVRERLRRYKQATDAAPGSTK